MKKLIRITTVPVSLENLLEGQLNYMQQFYDVLAVSSEEEKLQKLGEEIGVRTYAVDMTREITPLRDLGAVWKLYQLFKKEKPLIVHTHTPKAGIAGMLAAKMAGVPIRLHTLAGLPLLATEGVRRKTLEKVEKITFACATKIYPNSKKIYEYVLNQNYTSQDKLHVIKQGSSNGINTEFFNPEIFSLEDRIRFRQDMNLGLKDTVFVFIGRLVRDKGINELVEAFVEINAKYPDTSLLLVGPLEQDLDPLKKKTLKMMKDHTKIFEVGYQDDVRKFLACSDALVFPSYREGFPNVVMQAGSMGLPSIVTDINGCNEIIEENKNGTIVPVRNVQVLVEKMSRMVEDVTWRKNLASNARLMIKANYERRDVWKALLDEYRLQEDKFTKS